jgi:hypothetical protein
MLQRLSDTQLYLRTAQRSHDGKERARLKAAKQPALRQLAKDRFDRLVSSVATILKTGEPTVFEHEGSCRHGLRSALCLDGWSWEDADAAARGVVSKAYVVIGATRPTWQQGQPEWTQDGFSPVERTYCAHCRKHLPESEGGQNRIYCSRNCLRNAYVKRRRLMEVTRTRVEWLAEIAAETAKNLKQRERDCDHCGEPFIPDLNYKRRRFCSPECGHAAQKIESRRLLDRPCLQCGTMYRPKSDDSKYCSLECSGNAQSAAMRRPPKACDACGNDFHPILPSRRFCSIECRAVGSREIPDRPCAHCDMMFKPRKTKGKIGIYCSKECFGLAIRKPRPELTCETCKTVFRASYAAEVRRFCSQRCANDANRTFAADQCRPKRLRMPACEETTCERRMTSADLDGE